MGGVQRKLDAIFIPIAYEPVFEVSPQVGEVYSIVCKYVAKFRQGTRRVFGNGSGVLIRSYLLLKLVSRKYLAVQKPKKLLEDLNMRVNNNINR